MGRVLNSNLVIVSATSRRVLRKWWNTVNIPNDKERLDGTSLHHLSIPFVEEGLAQGISLVDIDCDFGCTQPHDGIAILDWLEGNLRSASQETDFQVSVGPFGRTFLPTSRRRSP